jgi:type I restriction enzyme, R subunit
MDLLAALAAEKDTALKAANDSGIAPRAFSVHWALKEDAALSAAGISSMEVAREADVLLARFPHCAVNIDEQRRLRAALYRPLIRLHGADRARVVDLIMKNLIE